MNYGLDPAQFLRHIIRPILQRLPLGLWSPSAEILVLGTALVESKLKYVDQVDKRHRPGPAFGPFQMEGATHRDLYRNFLDDRPETKNAVLRLSAQIGGTMPDPGEMVGNFNYACAMCRIHYLRVPRALPPTNDAMAHAEYHKQWYNTPLGKTKVEESVKDFIFAVELSARV